MPVLEAIMPDGFRADRDRLANRCIAALPSTIGFDYYGLATDVATGEAFARRIAAERPDAVLILPVMASPAANIWAALAPHAGIPVVIWNAHELWEIAPSYDMVDLCRHSACVGTMMVANVLRRHGRRPLVLTSHVDDKVSVATVGGLVRIAAAAGALRRARIARIGAPFEGYINVDLDPASFARDVGATIVDVELARWQDFVSAVTAREIDAAIAAIATVATFELRRSDPDLRAAARMTAALQRLVDAEGIDAGAINCRAEFGATNPAIASLSCLAVSVLTGQGIPFAGSGDLATAVAMLVGKSLSGGALYSELNTIDYVKDAFLCANTGETDFHWGKATTRPRVMSAGSLSGIASPGCCTSQTLPPGPATMIGFSPDATQSSGYSLVAAEGDILDCPPVAMPTVATWFQMATRPMHAAFDLWAASGATHHAALCPGALAADLALLGELIAVPVHRI